MMGQIVGSLYYLDPTVIPRLKSLRSGDDPVFSFGVLFYALKCNPRRVVQYVDDAAPFKSVFLDQMLHDLIVRMRIDAGCGSALAVTTIWGEKIRDCSVHEVTSGSNTWRIGEPGAVVDLQIRRILTDDEGKRAV